MRKSFRDYLRRLESQTQDLLASKAYVIKDGLTPDLPGAGVYLFSKGKKHLYVGRRDNIRRRMALHSRPSSSQNQATFAFRLAKKKLGIGKPTYQEKGSRTALAADPQFQKVFEESINVVRSLSVRFVRETDPIMQALLEIYVAVTLSTPYNEFKTT